MKIWLRLIPATILLAASFATNSTPSSKTDARIGMVVNVQGSGRLSVDGKSKALELLAYLEPRMQLELDAGSKASLSLYATRSLYQLTGPALVEVGADAIVVLKGNAPLVKPLAQRLVLAAQSGNRVHGAVRMRNAGSKVALVIPENGTVLVKVPVVFHWEAAEVGPYDVTITAADAPETILATAQVRETTWKLPVGVQLKHGDTYRWTVSLAMPRDGGADSGTGQFSIVSEADAELLAGLQPATDAPIEEWVLYASTLQERGIRDEARVAWKFVAGQRPDLKKAKQLAR